MFIDDFDTFVLNLQKAQCGQGQHSHAGISGCHATSRVHKDPKVRHHPFKGKEEMRQKSDPVKVLGAAFSNRGKQLYIVGGYVRDLVMGMEPHDMDMTTDALPEETKAILSGLGIGTHDIGGERHGCYSDDTEVLTRRGWVLFRDAREDDEFATINFDEFLEYQKPLMLTIRPYTGPMYKLKTRSVDLLVTPNHRLYVSKPTYFNRKGLKIEREFNFSSPDLFFGKNKRFIKGAKWNGVFSNDFILEGILKSNTPLIFDKIFEINAWLEFLGWFVAEGSTNVQKDSYQSTISCHEDEVKNISNILNKLNVKYSVFQNHGKGARICFSDRQLTIWLEENCGKKAANKKVPSFIKDLSSEQIVIFLNSLFSGDGKTYKGGTRVLTTVSRKLADDVQELILKVGNVSKISNRGKKYNVKINERIISSNYNILDVTWSHQDYYHNTADKGMANSSIEEWVDYNGIVYCAVVPNQTLYVRRNGIPVWCGNTVVGQFPEGNIEITTFRGEKYEDGSRQPIVSFGVSLLDDLSRRDFTFNAMVQRVDDGAIIDPFGGRDDLKNKVVRAVGDPDRRFTEDPLRMLRAIRFATKLGFNIDKETYASIERNAASLQNISKERIADETTKILVSNKPSRGIAMLVHSGLMKHIVPELYEQINIHQSPPHHKNVFGHTLEVVDNIPADSIMRWSALLHDIAKPRTKSIVGNTVHFYNHEHVGADMVHDILRRLKFPNDFTNKVAHIVDLHMRPNLYTRDQGNSAVRRLVRDAGEELPELLALSRADITSAKRQRVIERLSDIDHLEDRAKEIGQNVNIASLQSPLDGNEIMQMFNRQAGPWIAAIKNRLTALVVDGSLDPDDKEAAAEIARKIYEQERL